MDPLFTSALQLQQDVQAMKIGASVLKKTVDVQKTMSEAILTILDSAMSSSTVATPAGKAVGLGQSFDVSG